MHSRGILENTRYNIPRWSGGRGTFATGNGRNPVKTLGKAKKRYWGHAVRWWAAEGDLPPGIEKTLGKP